MRQRGNSLWWELNEKDTLRKMPQWYLVDGLAHKMKNCRSLKPEDRLHSKTALYNCLKKYFCFSCNFIPLHLLCIIFLKTNKNTTDLHNHTHRRQYSKQVCVLFGKSWVKDKNQRTDNFFLLLFCFLFLVKIPERPGLQAPQTSLLILTN